MFDHETEIILTTMRQRLPDRPLISMKDILAADIPHPIKTFFRTDIELLLSAETARTKKESRFTYDVPEIQHLQQQLHSLLVLHFTFDPAEFAKRLEDTLNLIVNYLVRPQWTLTEILFEQQEVLEPAALRGMLRYFGPYEYLHELLGHYLDEKKPASLSRAAFSTLVWKLDGEYLRRKTGDETARLLFPLFDFFDYPSRTGRNFIPVRALVRFFDDKGLVSVSGRLERELTGGTEQLTLQELSVLLEDVRRDSGAFAVTARENGDAAPISATQAEVPAVPPPPVVVQSPPLPVDPPPVVTPAGEPPPRQPAPQAEHVPDSIIFDIDESDRRKFLKKIFHQDEGSYDTTLRTLSRTPSWKKASALIDEVFINNDVDPYSTEARRFTEIIYHRYISPK